MAVRRVGVRERAARLGPLYVKHFTIAPDSGVREPPKPLSDSRYYY
jgi:hypothetical protein